MKNDKLILLVVAVVLGWATWFFRYTPTDPMYLMDRWSGEIVYREVMFPEKPRAETFLDK